MANWFKKTRRNGLTITQSTKGTTWSKSTKGGSVRHTVTHKADGKIVQTTTQRSPGGFVKIEKKVLNKKPKIPKPPKPKKIRGTRKVRYKKTKVSGPVLWFFILMFLLIVFLG